MRKIVIAVLVVATIAFSAQSSTRQHQPPRAWLGFGYTIHDFRPEAAVRQWLYVQRVEPNSPAFVSGLHVQDAIVAINGKPVQFASAGAALGFFRAVKVGTVLELQVLRRGRSHVLTLRAVEMPSMYSGNWTKNEILAREVDASSRKP